MALISCSKAHLLCTFLCQRCLVKDNDVQAPSYLLESVVNGDQQGRYSFVGAMPAMEVIATQNQVTVLDHCAGARTTTTEEDPMEVSWGGCHGQITSMASRF